MLDMIVSLMISLFVDDFVGGGDSGENAYTKFKKLVEILEDGSFHVHKFVANDEILTEKVRALNADYGKSDTEERRVHVVLGVTWDYKSDNLVVNLGEIVEIF